MQNVTKEPPTIPGDTVTLSLIISSLIFSHSAICSLDIRAGSLGNKIRHSSPFLAVFNILE